MILKKRLSVFFTKTLLCVILFLVMAILCKRDSGCSKFIYKTIYTDSISFSYFRHFYENYLGGVFPIENISNSQVTQVFHEELLYNVAGFYEDGVAVEVAEHYLVPIIKDGIVVYIGEKEKYGKVVIVEGNDGVDIWYGNMCNININLYDSLSIGSYLGEVCNNTLYLVFSNGNEYLDYKKYLG